MTPLGKAGTKAVHQAVAELFARARVRLLGREYGPKRILFGPPEVRPLQHRGDLSLPGIFDASAAVEGFSPSKPMREALMTAAKTYLDAYEAAAKARVVNAVEHHLGEVEAGRAKGDLRSALGGQLADVWATAARDVKRLVETETTAARNVGAIDGIQKVNLLAGISDPVVFFVVVRDDHRCEECTSLHLLDEVTPRVWKMSELESGYHQRGSGRPSIRGLHPFCRCSCTSLLPGFGFDSAGMTTYISKDYDEFSKQRG